MEEEILHMHEALKQYLDDTVSDEQREVYKVSLIEYFQTKEVAGFLRLICDLELYLNAADGEVRALSIQLIVDMLNSTHLLSLTSEKLHHLLLFFKNRIDDYPSLLSSLNGIKCLLLSYTDILEPKYDDCYEILDKIFNEVNVPSISQTLRSEIYSLIHAILGNPKLVKSLAGKANDIVEGILVITSGERDPRCLLQSLKLLEISLHIFSECSAMKAEKIFDSASGYFPITFRPPPEDKYGMTTEKLVTAVEDTLCCHSEVSKYVIPLLVDKLSSTDTSTDGKLDSLHCLVRLTSGFPHELVKGKVDYVLVVNIFEPSLPRLIETLEDIITSNAAGDEGEYDTDPTESKNSIVHGCLDCISALALVISYVHASSSELGVKLLQTHIEPILKRCLDAIAPGGTLQLNSLSGISAMKMLLAMAKSSYWFFSIILSRTAPLLLHELDSAILHGSRVLAKTIELSPAALSTGSLQFFHTMLSALGNSINFSDIILSGGSVKSEKELSSSYFVQNIFLSLLSRLQRILCLFESRSTLLDANWEVLNHFGDHLDEWMGKLSTKLEGNDIGKYAYLF